MAVTATLLTSGSTTSALSDYSTASITPGANKLILAFCTTTGPSITAVTATGNGLTWGEVAAAAIDVRRLTVFRAMGASPSAGVFTFDPDNSATSAHWAIVEFDGVDTSGTNGSGAVVQSKGYTNASGATSATITLDSAVGSGNAVAAGFCIPAQEAVTAGTGYTELSETMIGGPNGTTQTEFDDTGTTTAAASWTSSLANVVGVAVEIADAAAGGTSAPAEAASGTGAALDAQAAAGVNAEAPSGVGAALDATGGVGGNAGAATATGTASDAAVAVAANADAATATGTAYDATVSTSGGTSAPAEAATATGAAQDATVAAGVNAGAATGTGTALDASTAVAANAGAAAGTGTAYNATVSIGVPAEAATATGAAFDATTTAPKTAFAETAAAFGQAFDATVATVEPTYLFRTPLLPMDSVRPGTRGPQLGLMRHYAGYPKRGIAVSITGGVVREHRVIPGDLHLTADYVFPGGRENVVDQATADILIAAGYEVVSP
jgi:hypothetical protein